eukprot:TRINITY_DN3871_c0_g2_i2.p1 TRINITY_DN3871_c0_g2~~TRINITY_DN3871_c0_g2_i2.p1  ORF type:complete len:494 (+),score=47.17 TRINITY_DN3871_c0_g2_i2:99-1580(+)
MVLQLALVIISAWTRSAFTLQADLPTRHERRLAIGSQCRHGADCLSGRCGPLSDTACTARSRLCECQGRHGGEPCEANAECESAVCLQPSLTCKAVPLVPEMNEDTLELQRLVFEHQNTGRTLKLKRDEIVTTIVINGSIRIEGFEGKLTLDELMADDGRPPLGKLPAIVMVSNFPAPVFNIGPGDHRFSKEVMCTVGCASFASFYHSRSRMLTDISIKGVQLVGNIDRVSVHGKTKELYSGTTREGAVPGLPQRRALCLQKENPFFRKYEYEACTQIDELDFSRDAFNYVVSSTSNLSAIGGYSFIMDEKCTKVYGYGCKNVKASVVSISSVNGVTFEDTFVRNGNSACISAFFNSNNIKILRSRLHTSMYDGFGPDMLHDAQIHDSVLGPFGEHAAISISNGLEPAGTVRVSNTHFIGSRIPVYVNSNNKYEFEQCTVDGKPSCELCQGPKAKGACECSLSRNSKGHRVIDGAKRDKSAGKAKMSFWKWFR